jgi:hypothetical protein
MARANQVDMISLEAFGELQVSHHLQNTARITHPRRTRVAPEQRDQFRGLHDRPVADLP